ncbi:MAG TPA: type II toxin-antitoxin system RelE/ParE family toxin [Flavobacterium sp.]|nr:type II toxin-antitoxin system RelE/ParE family toxin [Flavobacterium sp.]
MELKVYWTDFAKNELKNIFDYHKGRVDIKIVEQITKQIIIEANGLRNFSEMGAVEELLQNRPENFRYIVSTNYKIIYWINKTKKRIEIIDVFDTRQNPIKITRNK